MDISPDDPTTGLAPDLEDVTVALVHDSIENVNGGINVEAKFARFFESPLYTLRQYEYPDVLDDVLVKEIKPREPRLSKALKRFGMGRLLERFRIHEYENWSPPRDADVVVTTGMRSQHVVQHPDQSRLHYFHTPARWLWNHSHSQFDAQNRLVRTMMLSFVNRQRVADVTTSHRIDHALVNSEVVGQRVRSYYGMIPEVIYPPIDTYDIDHSESEGFYLLLNRITPKKRTKLAVQAFTELGIELKVTGKPNDEERDYYRECQRVAGDNVDFVGWVSEDEKRDLLASCAGLVYPPTDEDFGMPPAEAMAAGKPVVGVREGFTKYQITDGENGVLFEPTLSSLVSAVKRCEEMIWDSEAIIAEARKYDIRRARKQWMEMLRSTLGREQP